MLGRQHTVNDQVRHFINLPMLSSAMNNRSTVTAFLVGASAAGGALMVTMLIQQRIRNAMNKNRKQSKCKHCLLEEEDRRARLPDLIILVRHGESESNADHTLWRKKADNLIELSSKGMEEADIAGTRLEAIFQKYDEDENLRAMRRIHLIVSPFERTLQTAFFIRQHAGVDKRIVRTEVESRIREQEFGNLQGDEFQHFRQEQTKVGRFWYRFPTGESGADVYDRVKSWWFESVLNVNSRVGYDPIDGMVIVTHGLTMRFVLMQLFHWSPTTFHSVWNAHNCDLYVLKKDLNKPGMSPYVLDDVLGESPQSSVDIAASFENGNTEVYKLTDYLSIPPPRTTRFEIIKEKLAEQYPSINVDQIEDITVLSQQGNSGPVQTTIDKMRVSGRRNSDDSDQCNGYNGFERAEIERSCRFPNLNPSDLRIKQQRHQMQ